MSKNKRLRKRVLSNSEREPKPSRKQKKQRTRKHWQLFFSHLDNQDRLDRKKKFSRSRGNRHSKPYTKVLEEANRSD